MDDHSQPDLRFWSVSDCRAAECAKPDRTEAERLAQQPAHLAFERPFVWQRGRRLLLLDWEMGCWVLAELKFDPQLCRYTELRRAFYRWEREALGALLSRTIAYGDEAAVESADLLEHWLRHRR